MDFADLYRRFDAPVALCNCGEHCAPYNELGQPFCCDITQTVPCAYPQEWAYLQAHTDLWRPWQGRTIEETEELQAQAPEGQVLMACLGHTTCQRSYRSITCRAFPFFPYFSEAGEFLGLSYYWAYEDCCWVISHLEQVPQQYVQEFAAAYEALFAALPDEQETYRRFSGTMRRVFRRRKRAILLLHRNGYIYKVSAGSGRMRRTTAQHLPAFGPYADEKRLKFPGEM